MDYKVTLSDGTEIWLNAESKIEFPKSFSNEGRHVKLSGEAYFKVARDEKRPFLVSTSRMDVRVLGTEFNLKSYAKEPAMLSLVNGSVEIMKHGSSKVEALLKPGQTAMAQANIPIKLVAADIYGAVQWKDGFFYFDEKPIVEILKELARWYNMGVIISRKAPQRFRVHFSASKADDIRQTISNLNDVSKHKVSIEGRNLVIR